jgi:4-hydroxy-tetrahydrodipicolinate synthase
MMEKSMSNQDLAGVYVAALTPLQEDFTPDLDAITPLLELYAQRGCHGALLLGTTGEGPSFAPEERMAIFRAASKIRQSQPDFRLMAGTGTPSMEETILLNRAAFDLGFQAVVVLPPYYFRQASEEGLFAWFREVIQKSVPQDGALLGYHIPNVSGVPLSLELLTRLKDEFPARFGGLKDSSGDIPTAIELGKRFGDDLSVFTGNDSLLSLAMENQAAGCITAMANLYSPSLRIVWNAHQRGEKDKKNQNQLSAWRQVLKDYSPYAPTLKALLAHRHNRPLWPVRPPLEAMSQSDLLLAVQQFEEATVS